MTRNGVGERIVLLRRRIATIEAREAPGHCPAGALARTSPRQIPEQDPFERLLRNLGSVSLCEIIPAHPRAAAAAAGFICALALRAAAARPGAGVVWIAEDMAAREIGLPYGKGLEARGFDPARLVFVKTRSPRETLWAMEEALKSRAVAIVAESWIAPRAYDLTASRRLLLTARRGGGLGLLLLPRASGEAARLTTAAPLRFEVAASPPPRRRSGGAAGGGTSGAIARPDGLAFAHRQGARRPSGLRRDRSAGLARPDLARHCVWFRQGRVPTCVS